MHVPSFFRPHGLRCLPSGRLDIEPAVASPCTDTVSLPPAASDLRNLFIAVVGAYSRGNLDEVRDLVTAELRDSLAGEVAERMRMGHVLTSSLVDLLSAEIIDSEDNLLVRSIDIRFVSRMIVALTDPDGAVLAGDPVHVRTLSEVWTLQRFGLTGEIWLVSAMEEDE